MAIPLAVAVVLLICGLQTPAGTSVLESLGLRAPAAEFVELAFADPAALPLVRDNADRPIETGGGGRTRLQTRGTETLQLGRSGSFPSAVDVASPRARASAARAMVRVRLVLPAEDILTWVACPSRAS